MDFTVLVVGAIIGLVSQNVAGVIVRAVVDLWDDYRQTKAYEKTGSGWHRSISRDLARMMAWSLGAVIAGAICLVVWTADWLA